MIGKIGEIGKIGKIGKSQQMRLHSQMSAFISRPVRPADLSGDVTRAHRLAV